MVGLLHVVHFGNSNIVFWIPMFFLSSFLIVGKEYGTA